MRAIIRFLNAKQKDPTELYKEIVEVSSENVFSRKQMSAWCSQFKREDTTI